MVEAHGQFAVRGGIVDVFPVGATTAVRLEFFDDEIDSLREFDVLTQRSVGKREGDVLPASETLLAEEEGAAADRLAKLLVSEKGRRPSTASGKLKRNSICRHLRTFCPFGRRGDDLPDALDCPQGQKGKDE